MCLGQIFDTSKRVGNPIYSVENENIKFKNIHFILVLFFSQSHRWPFSFDIFKYSYGKYAKL